MASRRQKKSSYPTSGRLDAEDRKPLAAFQLGLYSHCLARCDSFDEFVNILHMLTEDILPNPYAELQALLSVDREFRARFGEKPTPRGGWNCWQPAEGFRERLLEVADTALPLSNRYRRWYDLGRLLGKSLRQDRNEHLDVRELRNAVRMLPSQYLERLVCLKNFLRLTVDEAGGASGLQSALRRAVSGDVVSNGLEAVANRSEDRPTTELEGHNSRLESHLIVMSPLREAVEVFTERITHDLRELPRTFGPGTHDDTEDRDARDAWIYRQAIKGVPYDQIISDLKGNREDWTPIETQNGIKRAAERYAERHRLPLPPKRSPGRPKKTEPDR